MKDAGLGKGRGAFAAVGLPARAYLGHYEGDQLSAAQLQHRYVSINKRRHVGTIVVVVAGPFVT